jgi:AGCS family alanine or glycine:cation symporter
LTLTIRLLTFVFTTLVGWAYYGEKAVEYLFGERAVLPYRWLWVVALFVGAALPLPVVWAGADVTNALMAIPNLIALLLLSGVVVRETRGYLWENRLDDEMDAAWVTPPHDVTAAHAMGGILPRG